MPSSNNLFMGAKVENKANSKSIWLTLEIEVKILVKLIKRSDAVVGVSTDCRLNLKVIFCCPSLMAS